MNEVNLRARMSHVIKVSMAANVFGTLVLCGTAGAADLAPKDKAFLQAAGEAGNTEIAASQLAQNKSASVDVKTFASSMLSDHTKVADQLKALASKKGVDLPAKPNKAHQAEISKLGKLDSTGGFDFEYTDAIGVAAHKEAVALFEEASASAYDADVKAFAAENLPALKHHLQMALTLQSSLKK